MAKMSGGEGGVEPAYDRLYSEARRTGDRGGNCEEENWGRTSRKIKGTTREVSLKRSRR